MDKGNWTWKKFLALLMAVVMVMASGVFVTTQSFKATDDESYKQDEVVDSDNMEVTDQSSSEEAEEINVDEQSSSEESSSSYTTEEITLTYDANASDVTGDVPETVTTMAGSEVTVAKADSLSREGYVFDGWNTKEDGTGDKIEEEQIVNVAASTTLYAQWIASEEEESSSEEATEETSSSEEVSSEEASSSEEVSSEEASSSEEAEEETSSSEEATEEASSSEEIGVVSGETVSEEASSSEEAEEATEDTSSSETQADSEKTAEERRVEDETKAIENNKPAVTLTGTTAGGVKVTVTAKEGIFPNGTTMQVADISTDEALAAVEGTVDRAVDAVGVDITFFDVNGSEIQPDGKVDVSIQSGTAVLGDDYALVHVEDDGTASEVTSADVSATGAEFKASEFSAYILVVANSTDEGSLRYFSENYKIDTWDITSEPYENIKISENIFNDLKGYNKYVGGTWAIDDKYSDLLEFADGADTTPADSDERISINVKAKGKAGTAVLTYTYEKGSYTYHDTFNITIKEYIVNFNLNGGSGTVPDSISVDMKDYTTLVQMPGAGDITRSGYKLIGWTTEPSVWADANAHGWGATRYDLDDGNANTTVDMYPMVRGGATSVTLYAIWVQTSGVTYNNIGFYIRKDGIIQTEPNHYPGAEYDVVYFPPTYSDESFDGYSLCTRDLSRYLTGVYTETRVEVVPYNLTAFTYSQLEKANELYYEQTGSYYWNPDTEYIKWYVIKNQGGVFHVDGVKLQKDLVSLNYDPNTGTYTGMAPDSIQHGKGSEVTIEGSNTLTSSGYTFGGWNTKADGTGITYQEGDKITVNQDTTLYARWIPNGDTRYTIECYDSETGAIISTAYYSGETGAKVEATDANKTIEGYLFDDENENNVLSGTIAGDSSTKLKLYFKKTHDIKIYLTGSRGEPYYTDYTGEAVTGTIIGVSLDGYYTDQIPYSNGSISLTDESGNTYLIDGLDVEVEGNATDAGTYDVTIPDSDDLTMKINGEVAKEYTIEVIEGEITINPLNIKVISDSDEKDYDGTALTKHSVTYSDNSAEWLGNDEPEWEFTGAQKTPGSSDNTFAPKGMTWDELNESLPNYNITHEYGTLTVNGSDTKYEITIYPEDISTTYDGEVHKADKYDIGMVGGEVQDSSSLGFLEKIKDGISGKATIKFTRGNGTYTLTGLYATGEGTDAGDYELRVDGEATIKDQDGEDVSNLFNVKTNTGTLSIAKATVTVESDSLTKEYDGDPLVNGDTPFVSEEGWADGEGATYKFTGSQTAMGSSSNTFEVESYNEGTNSNNYNPIQYRYGTLTVTKTDAPLEATITPNSATVTYDGEEHTVEGFDGQLEDGRIPVEVGGKTYYVSNAYAEATATNATSSDGVPVTVKAGSDKGFVVKDANGNNVTDTFNINVASGASLVINKRNVTFTSATLTKTYDGDMLTNPEGELVLSDATIAELSENGITLNGNGAITQDGLVSSDAAPTFTFDGGRTLTGESENSFDISWDENTKANYNISTAFGKLIVTKADYTVTLTGKDITSTYSGKYRDQNINGGFATITYNGTTTEVTDAENKSGNYNVVIGGKTYTISGVYSHGVGRHADEYPTVCSTDDGAPWVEDADGNNVSDNFNIALVPGKFTINPKEITIKSADLTKIYDGTALTNGGEEVTYPNGGLEKGDCTPTITFNGSQTLVGSSDNSFSYAFECEEAANDYNITSEYGTLTVTDGGGSGVDDDKVVSKTHEAGVFKVGDTITFTVTAKNIYDDARTITFTEQEGVTLEQSVFENVAPGAEVSTTATYTATKDVVAAGEYTNEVVAAISDGGTYEATDKVEEDEFNSEATYEVVYHNAEDGSTFKPQDIVDGSTVDRQTIFGGKVGDTVSVSDDDKTLSGYTFDASNENNKLEAEIEDATGTTLDVYFIPGHEVTIVFSGTDGIYNGQAHEVNTPQVLVDGVEVTGETLDGSSLKYTYRGKTYTLTNVASAITKDGHSVDEINEAGDYEITLDGDKSDITAKLGDTELSGYSFNVVNGSVSIAKRAVTVTSGSGTWEYDGKAHTNDQITYSETTATSGWLEGDEPDNKLKTIGSQKAVGTSANTIVNLKNDTDWTLDYPNYAIEVVTGTLEVVGRDTKYQVTVTPKSFNTTYNGEEQALEKTDFAVSGATSESSEKSAIQSIGDFFTRTETKTFTINGEEFTLTGLKASGGGTDVKEEGYDTIVTGTEKIVDSDGNDVTDQFNLDKTTGKIYIAKADVTLESVSISKQYDGTELTNGDNELTQTGWIDGEGIDSVTFTESVILPGEVKDNLFVVDSLKNNTNANNYNISYVYGKLKITNRDAQYEVTVTPNGNTGITPEGGTFKYDGTDHTVSGFVGQEEDGRIPVEVEGKTYYVTGITATGTITDAGTKNVDVEGVPVVTDENGNDVSSEFNINITPATLKVEPRTVVIKAASLSKEYDGEALSNPAGELIVSESQGITVDRQGAVEGDGFVEGQEPTYNFSGSRTIVGFAENVVSYTLPEGVNSKNYNITTENGTLNVTNRSEDAKYTATIKGNTPAPIDYDGDTHTASGFVGETEDGVPIVIGDNTYYVTGITTVAEGKDAGTHTGNVEGTPVVKDKDGNDVTDQFVITVDPSVLVINPKNVTLKSADLSKTYDGKALTNGDTRLEIETGWANGEGATYTFTGSRTLVGFSSNEFSYVLNSNTKASNYNISKSEGTLTVNPRAEDNLITLDIYGKSDTFTYDGTEKSVEGFENTTDDGIVAHANGETYYITGITSTKSGVNASDSGATNINGTPVIKDADGNDVSDQFNINYEPGTLTIEKRDVVITSASLSKAYDGNALMNPSGELEVVTTDGLSVDVQGSVSGEGFAEGEGVTYNFTGRQKIVGISSNSYDITPNEGTNLDNYNITKNEGTLAVTNAGEALPISITAKSDSVMYDGKPHTVSGFEGEDENGRIVVESGGNTYYVTGITSTKTGTNASDSGQTVVSGTPIVTDAEGNNVSDQFAISVVPGTLEIAKRHITLESQSRTKVYDGYALTNGDGKVTVGGDGVLESERLVFTFTGSQTLVGSSDNSFTYGFAYIDGMMDTGAEASDTNSAITMGSLDNYEVETIFGKLTVTTTGTNEDGEDETVDPSKVVNKTHEDGIYSIGQTVDFTLTATNIYSDARTITFTEQENVTIDQAVWENVAGGATVTTKAHYTITEADALAGEYINKASASISDTLDPAANPEAEPGNGYEAEDKVIPESPNGSISIIKKSNTDTAVSVGDTIEYTVTVVNNGNVTAKDVEVEDELTGDTWTVESLEPKATKDFTAEYTVTEKDVAEGKVTNVATAKAKDGDGNAIEGEGDTSNDVSQSFNLIIHYTDENGTQLAADYTGTYQYKDSFYIQSPVVSGYTPKYAFVASYEEGMPARDVEVTVEYVKNPENLKPADSDNGSSDDDNDDSDGNTDNDGGSDNNSDSDNESGSGDSGNNGGLDINGGSDTGNTTDNSTTTVDNSEPVGTEAGVTSDGTVSVSTSSVTATDDTVAAAGVEPGGAVVTIGEDGEPQLVSASDTETPLFNMNLEDHLCNVLHFLLLLCALAVVTLHTNRMKSHQQRIFELREKLDEIKK